MDAETLALLVPLAALCLPAAGLIIVLGFVLGLRYLPIKETRILLDRGADPEIMARQRASRPSRAGLFAGIILSLIGLALSVALYPIGFVVGASYPLGLGPWMIAGLLPLFIGVALLLWHYLNSTGDGGAADRS